MFDATKNQSCLRARRGRGQPYVAPWCAHNYLY